ncbi:MAG: BamA/TamA family outer membrane protein [Polyangiales bacterium]
MPHCSRRVVWAALWLLSIVVFSACAEVPKQRYGIERLRFVGMKELSSDALRACLATEQREKVSLGLGALVSPSCGEPPFDKKRWSARLFAMPWTDWPAYDEALLRLDLDRIERWYQARGYYGVRVLDVKFSPDVARKSDNCEGEDCELKITVNIDEGQPIRIRKLDVVVEADLTPELKEDILDAMPLRKGQVFDEAAYDDARLQLATVLREAGYPRTAVVGDIVVNRGLLVADIKFTVTPGPLCHFGKIEVVEKGGGVPTAPVIAATLLKKGQPYHESSLLEAQRAIYALGAFSSVVVRGDLDSEGAEVPIVVELEARRTSQVMVGAGILAGTVSSGIAAEEAVSVPQWDVHLLGSYENRNFFGGLRRFRVEERPRLLFLGQFPSAPNDSPRFGNTITANFSQPGVIDPRTNLFVETRWDNGPDPFLLFFRNDIGLAIGLERGFFKQLLNVRVAIHQEIMETSRRQPVTDAIRRELNQRYSEKYAERDPMYDADMMRSYHSISASDRKTVLYEEPKSYRLPFFEQRITLDLRDDAVRPTKGGYFRVSAHEALRMWDPSWTYIRLAPEARGYAPVGLGMVLAARFALASLHVLNSSSKLDESTRKLGPQSYRLRGGGANSNRGFAAGQLGDGLTGGVRRWEASLELRVPLSRDFWLVGFGDMGDVNSGIEREPRYYPDPTATAAECEDDSSRCGEVLTKRTSRNAGFRFSHLNTAVGAGLRYYTIIGPIRLDVGYRPKALAGKSDDNQRMDLGFTKFRGAVHLTIGDAF